MVNAELLEYVETWARATERIVGAAIKKNKIRLSDPQRENIRIDILQKAADLLGVQVIFRDALRYRDMGAGSGYHKGKRTAKTPPVAKRAKTLEAYTERRFRGPSQPAKIRKPAPIVNRPLYGRLSALSEAVSYSVAERILSALTNPTTP